jgi:acyl-CoA thioester hydrolase
MDLRTCSESEVGRTSVCVMEGCGKQTGSRYFPPTEMPSQRSLNIRNVPSVYRHSISVSQDAIDVNGHVNNVEYLRWMQDAAVGHADATGSTAVTRKAGASWVVRSHHIEYLQPTFAGDRLVVLTWVSNLRKASSLRKYLVVRETDRALIARGETNWVFIESHSGRPIAIPKEVFSLFEVVPPSIEPRDGSALERAAVKHL